MQLGLTTRWKWLCLALGGVALLGSATAAYALLGADAPAGTVVPPTELDPAKVMGPQACVECHKPAIAAWQLTKHANGLDMLRQNPNAKNYANALNIPFANVTTDSICVKCHGLNAQGSAIKQITGVSCESCHGASGGTNGWLNPHGSYGTKDTTREMETPAHLKERFAVCDKAGMIRPERDYLLVKNCFGCHIVPFENLVNVAGHHASSGAFEAVSWMQGEVCHNLFLNPKVNAQAPTLWMARTGKTAKERKRVLYVLGQIADLEVSLTNLSKASGESSYTQAMALRARNAAGNIDLITSTYTLPDIQKALSEFKRNQLRLRPSNKLELLKVAEAFSIAAEGFAKTHDGSKLDQLDQIIPTVGQGTRYSPPAN